MRSRITALAESEGISLNQFIALTLAEKLGASSSQEYFTEKRKNANFGNLRAFLARSGGEAPREGDELPENWGS